MLKESANSFYRIAPACFIISIIFLMISNVLIFSHVVGDFEANCVLLTDLVL